MKFAYLLCSEHFALFLVGRYIWSFLPLCSIPTSDVCLGETGCLKNQAKSWQVFRAVAEQPHPLAHTITRENGLKDISESEWLEPIVSLHPSWTTLLPSPSPLQHRQQQQLIPQLFPPTPPPLPRPSHVSSSSPFEVVPDPPTPQEGAETPFWHPPRVFVEFHSLLSVRLPNTLPLSLAHSEATLQPLTTV